MNKLTTPEQLESKGITEITVTYIDEHTGFKKWLTHVIFNRYMRNTFDIYNWCIFRESIIELAEKGICKIEYR